MAKTATSRKRSMSGFIGAAGGLPAAPANTTPPEITGTAEVGETLTAAAGVWTGREQPTVTRQWRRGGADIIGATGSTYQLQAADEGETITVRETAMNWAGVATATSEATDEVTA
jgi:hypothetical protein